MADQANFTVRLIDKVSSPAKSAEKALGRVREANGRFVKQSDAAEKAIGRRRTANGRFVKSTTSVTKATGKQVGILGRLRTTLGKLSRRSPPSTGGRFTDKSGRLREADGRFVGSGGRGGGLLGGLGFGGGALDVLKGNLLTAAVGKMVDLATATARAGWEFATFGQNARLGFSNLTKHGAQPEQLFEHARELAKRFGLDVFDTSKQYQKFLALQFTPKAIDGLIKMGADLRALGTDAEGVQGVFTAIGQIKGKGRVQGEELLQLAERNISTAVVQEEIGKLLGGKTQADVQKLMQAGKVSADVGLKAIESTINRKLQQNRLGESGAKFADQTIDGLVGRFKAYFQSSGITAFDKAAAPITKVLGKTFDKLVAFLDSPRGADLINQIAGSIERMAAAAAEMGGDFATKFIEADWKAIGKDILDIADGLISAARAAGELAKTLGFGGPESETQAEEPKLTQDHASVLGFAAAGAATGAVVGSIIPGIGTVAGAAVGGLAGASLALLENVGVDAGIAVSNGLASGRVTDEAYAAGVAIGDNVDAGTRDALGIHSPSRVAMADGRQVARGLALGMRRGARDVDAANDYLVGRVGTGGFGPDSFASVGPQMASLNVPAVDSAGGGGSNRINMPIHIEVSGASGNAEEIGRVAARETRREIESFFRQLAMEG